MNKLVLFGLIFLFQAYLLFHPPTTFGANGCGGTSTCESTKIVGVYECELVGNSCQKSQSGTETIDCNVTENDCFGYARTYNCIPTQGGDYCDESLRTERVSCCSNSGGGGYTCQGETSIEMVCVATGGCKYETFGTCAPGKSWCATLVCNTCSATAPVVTVTQTDSQAYISWTATGGVSYQLYVGSDLTMVNNNCSGTGTPCVYSSTTAVSPTIVGGLESGKLYYVRVVNYKDAACSTETATRTLSCAISPSYLLMNVSGTASAFVSVTAPSESPTYNFSSSDPSIVNVSATGPDATLTALSTGSTTVNAQVTASGQTFICDSLSVDVVSSGPWWQVIACCLNSNPS